MVALGGADAGGTRRWRQWGCRPRAAGQVAHPGGGRSAARWWGRRAGVAAGAVAHPGGGVVGRRRSAMRWWGGAARWGGGATAALGGGVRRRGGGVTGGWWRSVLSLEEGLTDSIQREISRFGSDR